MTSALILAFEECRFELRFTFLIPAWILGSTFQSARVRAPLLEGSIEKRPRISYPCMERERRGRVFSSRGLSFLFFILSSLLTTYLITYLNIPFNFQFWSYLAVILGEIFFFSLLIINFPFWLSHLPPIYSLKSLQTDNLLIPYLSNRTYINLLPIRVSKKFQQFVFVEFTDEIKH